jgi:integrase
MYLAVQPSGAKLWRLKCRREGRENLFAIGEYPAVSLADARVERDRARELIRAGKNPATERRVARARGNASQASTFSAIAEEWFKAAAAGANRERRPWSPAHRSAQRTRLDEYLAKDLGELPLIEVKAPQLLEVLRKLEDRGALEVAAKCRVMASQIFRYAIATSRAEVDPADLLRGAIARPERKHRATVAGQDLPRLFDALREVPAESVTKLALAWIILTVSRTSETRFAPWGEIEGGKLWRIPSTRMKMRLDHLVPLSRQAQEILTAAAALRASKAGEALIFPGFTRHGALSENAFLALLARAGYFGRQTAHGFRAAFSTWAHEVAEADPDVIEACLAHTRGDIRGIYNRAQYLSRRRELLQRWADQCSAWGLSW